MTIHAQDFKDKDGDRKIGRQTIPIVFSATTARYSLIIPLMAWSIALCYIWRLNLLETTAFMCMGLIVSHQYWKASTVYEYQVAFYWYNVSQEFI